MSNDNSKNSSEVLKKAKVAKTWIVFKIILLQIFYIMVSLGPTRGQGQSGHSAFAFHHTSDRESVRSEDVDLLTESTYLTPHINGGYYQVCLCFPWIAGLEALLLVLYEVSIFVFADVLSITGLGGKDARFSFLTLLHVVLWLVVMTCHFLLWLQHYQLQLRGYLNFCHTTQKLRIIPPLVMTFGNAIFLAFFSIMEHAWSQTKFHHYHFVQIVYSLEFLVMFPSVIIYIVKVLKFKRDRGLPDCYAVVDNNFQMDVDGEVGYSDTAWPNSVLEKQADMIRYLQRHNENLSRRLLRQTHAACS